MVRTEDLVGVIKTRDTKRKREDEQGQEHVEGSSEKRWKVD